MKTRRALTKRTKTNLAKAFCWLLLVADASRLLADPTPADAAAFATYTRTLEARLAQQHRAAAGFLMLEGDPAAAEARLRQGEILIDRIPASADVPGALLHHWRGTAFAPGAHAADFDRLMQNFAAYPQRFAPQVVAARALTPAGPRMQAAIRLRQHHVITVVMDTAYDVTFGQLDPAHGYSISRSTRVDEIEGAGTKAERVLGSKEEHGFLWCLNTYWTYEERNGGLYLQLESVSLTRAIPRGLGWAVRPYVESIPRESMEFTLRSACAALKK